MFKDESDERDNSKLNNVENLRRNIKENIKVFKNIFINDDSLVIREFENKLSDIQFCIIFINGMINKDIANEHIIKPLMNFDLSSLNTGANVSADNLLEILSSKVIFSSELKKSRDINDILLKMMYGDTIILVNGIGEALIADTKGFAVRPIEEPGSESVIKGSREGFTESLATNLTLIRKRIRTSNLKFVVREMGEQTNTKICIVFIEGIVSKIILKEFFERLKKIDADSSLFSNSIEEYIRDCPLSIFKTIGNSERPDVVCGKLLEGRIAVICDGTPFVLTLPYIFEEYFQSIDDYTNNYMFGTVNRWIRMLAFFLGISVPAVYTAITTFHQEILPTPLLTSIATAREGVPFPTVVEAILMILGFEILREAGVRLPKTVGQAISTVGALILGEAAVNARIVSAPMVIVAAVTGITSFVIPKMLTPFIVIRIVLLALAAFLGLYGYMFGIIGLYIYLVSMRSFGIPYMLYTSEIKAENIKDTVIRAPWYMIKYRPKFSGWNFIRKKGAAPDKREGD